MIKQLYSVSVRVVGDEWQFEGFVKDSLKMTDLLPLIEDVKVLDYDYGFTVTTDSKTVAHVVKKQLSEIAELYGVVLV